MPKQFDPLAVIPSAAAVRKRLEIVQREARRLKILLRTAEQIEKEQPEDRTAEARQGVASAQ